MKRFLGLNPLLFIVLACVVVIGGLSYVYLYLISPVTATRSALSSEIRQTQLQIDRNQKQIHNAKKINKDSLLTALPADNSLDTYLMQLNALAAQDHCTLLSLAPSQKSPSSGTGATATGSTSSSVTSPSPSSKNGATQAPTKMKISSSSYDLTGSATSFSDMSALLHDLETMKRITYVDNLHFSGTSKGLNFNLTLTIYNDPRFHILGQPSNSLAFPQPAKKNTPF